MFLGVLNTVFFSISNFLSHFELRIGSIQIIIVIFIVSMMLVQRGLTVFIKTVAIPSSKQIYIQYIKDYQKMVEKNSVEVSKFFHQNA